MVWSWPVAARPSFGEENQGAGHVSGVVTPRLRAGDQGAGAFWCRPGTWPEWLRYQPMKGVFQSDLLGEDTELERQMGEQDGGVHVAEVVGGVDGGFRARGVFSRPMILTGEKLMRSRVRAQRCADGMLLPAGFVPQFHRAGRCSRMRPWRDRRAGTRSRYESQPEEERRLFGPGAAQWAEARNFFPLCLRFRSK